VTGCYSLIDISANNTSMQSAGSSDAVSPRHFIIEKGLIDARGEVGARAQVVMASSYLLID